MLIPQCLRLTQCNGSDMLPHSKLHIYKVTTTQPNKATAIPTRQPSLTSPLYMMS